MIPSFPLVISILLNLVVPSKSLQSPSVCKVLPGDSAWPSDVAWNDFNASVDGRLIRTIPIGSPCHNPTLDEEKCAFVRNNWHETALHLPSSSSVMTPFFANKSCDPFTAPSAQCVIGSYVQYSVNVSTTGHIAKTLAFAKLHNIRFVLRNTGHDYMGKSTGTGGLAIWTHYLQDTQWIENFVSSNYQGPAIKAQAGVSVHQMYREANSKGYVVVGSDCLTVGYAGGYIQGGGHSSLSSMLGLAADSALSYEVVTTNGDLVTASPSENEDLYWALSGGGGGTYGIVWSVTVKAHPNFPVTVANLTFAPQNISQDVYWEGITAYQAISPSFTAAGAYAIATYGTQFFQMAPLFAPNLTIPEVMKLVQPLLGNLTALGINHTFFINTHPTFQTGFNSVSGFADLQVGIFSFGGRLLPRSLFQSSSSLLKTISVLRGIADGGGLAYDLALRPTVKVLGSPSNAVLPAWREAERLLITLLPWNDTATEADIIEQRRTLTTTFDGPLRQLAPNSGTYLNEADTDEPDWQKSFYGSNYAKLLQIKDKWDPDQLLYGSTAVGGDRWQERSDGRLCKT